MIITFTIPGIPQQQGSKRHVGNGVMIDMNKKLKPWREVALSCATGARPGDLGPTFTDAVDVTIVCHFPRPKSHYRTGKNAHLLREDAPAWHASAPDLDKVQRAIGDILTQSQMIRDDRLISSWQATKFYSATPPCVTVRLESLR